MKQTKKPSESRHKALIDEKAVKDYGNWKQSDLIKHILSLKKQIADKEVQIRLLTTENRNLKIRNELLSKSSSDLLAEQFKQEWPFSTKLVYTLSVNDKPMTYAELMEGLMSVDEQINNWENPKSTVSKYLNRVVASGRVNFVKFPGFAKYYYVLPSWFDDNGILKQEYRKRVELF